MTAHRATALMCAMAHNATVTSVTPEWLTHL